MLIAGSFVTACGGGTDSASEQQIRLARDRFNLAIVERDVPTIAALLAPSYHLVSSRNSQTGGVGEALEMWGNTFARDTAEFYVRTPREIRVHEAWGQAEELGDWDGHRSQGGEPVRVFGTYAAKWIRNSGEWTLQSEVFTLTGCEGAEAACAPSPTPVVTPLISGTTALLQAVSVVDADTVWVSGHNGTFARTTDGGATWTPGVVPDADTLQFRDVHAVNGSTAYLLAAGLGNMSRIYKTTDGGANWDLQFLNDQPDAFFDCLDFWDAEHGTAFSDAVAGEFVILETSDGGVTWEQRPATSVADAQDGEGSFAASGTCLTVSGDRHGWIGTGAADTARILITRDRGLSWIAVNTPIIGGEASGIAALAFADTMTGWAFGGDIGDPNTFTDNVAMTSDGGLTWALLGRPTFTGAVYGASIVPSAPSPSLVVVGPGGMDYSIDGGASWGSLDTLTYWAVDFASPNAGWAVGPRGRLAKISLYR